MNKYEDKAKQRIKEERINCIENNLLIISILGIAVIASILPAKKVILLQFLHLHREICR